MAAVKNTPWCDSQWHLYFINGASTGKAHQIFISISRFQSSILFSYYILVIFKLFQILTLIMLDILITTLLPIFYQTQARKILAITYILTSRVENSVDLDWMASSEEPAGTGSTMFSKMINKSCFKRTLWIN